MNNKETRKMYLIGTNIFHSQSPILYNQYFNDKNINMKYELYDTNDLNSFVEFAKNNDVFGFNITMPYKNKIIKYLDYMDENVIKSNSCNLVQIISGKLYGYNTDGVGFYNFIIENNIFPKNVVIIGKGCAGRSIEHELEKHQIKNIFTISHETNNDITKESEIIQLLKNSDLIINASNAGFSENNEMPIKQSYINEICRVNSKTIYIDIIYNPIETKTLKEFKNCGIKTYNGEGMLKFQFYENIKILFK